jgi:hypothetical protein
MIKEDFEYCLNLVKEYVKRNDYFLYESSINLANMVSMDDPSLAEGGMISTICKIYKNETSSSEETSLFSFSYSNRGALKNLYSMEVYYEYTHIINPSKELFEFAFNECINKLK